MQSVVLSTPLARTPSSCHLELGSSWDTDSWSDRGSIQNSSLVRTCACHRDRVSSTVERIGAFYDGQVGVVWISHGEHIDQMSPNSASLVQRKRGVDCFSERSWPNFPANECDRTDERVVSWTTRRCVHQPANSRRSAFW